jgi:hypothetical protein
MSTSPRESSGAASVTSMPADGPTTKGAGGANPWTFMFDVHHNPCFQQSLGWGGGVGTALAIHSAIRHRAPMKSVNAFMGGFLLVSSVSWLYCRQSQRKEQAQMRQLVATMRAQDEKKAAAAAAAAGAASTAKQP